MRSIQIHPIDADVQDISIQLSSLGITEQYNLNRNNEWRIDVTQPLGTFSYLEVLVNGEAVYGSPIYTANEHHQHMQYHLEQDVLVPQPSSPDTMAFQYLWGIILLSVFISLYWRRQ